MVKKRKAPQSGNTTMLKQKINALKKQLQQIKKDSAQKLSQTKTQAADEAYARAYEDFKKEMMRKEEARLKAADVANQKFEKEYTRKFEKKMRGKIKTPKPQVIKKKKGGSKKRSQTKRTNPSSQITS